VKGRKSGVERTGGTTRGGNGPEHGTRMRNSSDVFDPRVKREKTYRLKGSQRGRGCSFIVRLLQGRGGGRF